MNTTSGRVGALAMTALSFRSFLAATMESSILKVYFLMAWILLRKMISTDGY